MTLTLIYSCTQADCLQLLGAARPEDCEVKLQARGSSAYPNPITLTNEIPRTQTLTKPEPLYPRPHDHPHTLYTPSSYYSSYNPNANPNPNPNEVSIP